jgi:lipopolysaccharide export system protein LptA
MKKAAVFFVTAVAIAGIGAVRAEESKLFQDFRPGSDEAINVEADKLEVSEKGGERISVFTGNVTVRRGATVLKATTITIHSDLGTPQAGKEAFNLIEAEGKVNISENDQTATGDAASFNMKSQVATISGNVMLAQGTNILSGDRLIVDLNSGTAKVEQAAGGRIKGVFTPSASKAPAGE